MTDPCFRTQHLELLPPSLLNDPLDYIASDHLRQRVLCLLCDRIADAAWVDAALVEEVLTYLTGEMAIHVIDEEEDLFPLLRKRALEDDEIENVLGHLSAEHAKDEKLAEQIIAGLKLVLKHPSKGVPQRVAEALHQFARSQRRHLALENATIIPLAKVRLTKQDLRELAIRMAARRGVNLRPSGGEG